MNTKLIEFLNTEDEKLRGIMTLPSDSISGGVICLHGFERCSTTEKKFKMVADNLADNNISTLRFDFSGCGLSDGDFRFTTIEKQGLEFLNATDAFQKEIGNDKISIIAHSLGACVLANQIEKIADRIEKIILIAPALNQKDLLRYWFVVNQMKQLNPNTEINWENYKNHLSEEEFMVDCKKENKMAKANYINSEYFLTGKDFDFSNNFNNINLKNLHIHGNNDMAVPLSSLNAKFENQIIVDGGDHDLEKPTQLKQWLEKSVEFLGRN